MNMKMMMMKAIMVGVAIAAMLMGPASCGRGYTFTPVPNDERCRIATEYCTVWQIKICCQGLACISQSWSPIGGVCTPVQCIAANERCNLLTDPCCYPNVCSSFDGNGRCLPGNSIAQV